MVETWMEVEAHQFHGPVTTILHQMIVNPMYGIACNEQTIETEMEKLGKVLDVRVRGKAVKMQIPCRRKL